jgi:peptide/nickel transport system permease protein
MLMGTGRGDHRRMIQQLHPGLGRADRGLRASIVYKRKLGLYGKLFDSTIGMIGFALVMFWVFVACFGASTADRHA